MMLGKYVFGAMLLSLTSAKNITVESLSAREVDRFPKDTKLAGISTRSNGDLLVVETHPNSSIWIIREPASTAKRKHLRDRVRINDVDTIFSLSGALPSSNEKEEMFVAAAMKMTKIETDKADITASGIPDKFSAWNMAFTQSNSSQKATHRIRRVSNLTRDSYLMTSIATIPNMPSVVLVADSYRGRVGRLDLKTGVFDPRVISAREMLPLMKTGFIQGVNHILVHEGYLYFTNAKLPSVYRVKVSPDGRSIKGFHKPEVIIDLTEWHMLPKALTFDADGNLYAGGEGKNHIVFVDFKTWKAKVVLGGKKSPAKGVAGLAFGNGKVDKKTLYLTTLQGRVLAIETWAADRANSTSPAPSASRRPKH
ncbi:hypothetical protein NM208_g17142 [Fusarium decemcellulare]|uniref:Uncharacterized protein n=1 Tax=Fusarium decemcellulare TaxID=57161 RepID=A0ACC1R8Q2_9HYPO|nr:hypothetical protein NM208_g17142 [Fusarium decemcellulare]